MRSRTRPSRPWMHSDTPSSRARIQPAAMAASCVGKCSAASSGPLSRPSMVSAHSPSLAYPDSPVVAGSTWMLRDVMVFSVMAGSDIGFLRDPAAAGYRSQSYKHIRDQPAGRGVGTAVVRMPAWHVARSADIAVGRIPTFRTATDCYDPIAGWATGCPVKLFRALPSWRRMPHPHEARRSS
ncbi:protein of unknown function (plasmid) [Cupriavidus neocaledonicus]|uniref:Uncharacterized protein n=1 Tax=Cupriavidus neocaledonicus TaxID=1040979 RepID=A0A375HTK5_9BURK|nr:protein of unknown function [Cupriavidus neocaledonicus]